MSTTPAPVPHDGLLDAGLAPVDAPDDGHTDTMRARTYTHPALGGRPVVRLVPDVLGPAEDAAVDFLGFESSGISAPVTRTRPRGLGYPEWALVHDPDHRAEALALVRPLERAARWASSRPSRAEEEYTRLAADVPVSHLPSYWEQAGRAFVAAGNGRLAGIMFGRAREAERVYALPVDEDTRREAFLEFAFAGALTAKALAGHATELAERYEPSRAHAEFLELCLRRARGGLPPWAGLSRQLRLLAGGRARAEGLDTTTEETGFLRDLLSLPAVDAAPEGFWKAERRTVVRAARADPDLRRALLGLFVSGSQERRAWWLDLLDDIGAVDMVADPDEDVPGGAADWFSRVVTRTVRGRPAQLLDWVPRLAERLRADGVPVRLRGRVWVDLLETCLRLGVPVEPPQGRRESLDLYTGACREEDGCALAAILADEHWEPVLARSVAEYAGYRHKLEELLPSPCLHPYIDRRLGELVAPSAMTGLTHLKVRLRRLRSEVDGAALAAFPHRREEFDALDPARALATALRAGIIDEFGWPELEEAVNELRASGAGPVISTYSWPVITLTSRTRAIAVGPEGRVDEHDIRASDPYDIAAVYSDGAFLVCYRKLLDDTEHAYWSSDPETSVACAGTGALLDAAHAYSPGPETIAQLTRDGLRMNGGRALRRGEEPDGRMAHLLHDGATFWASGPYPGLKEVDPGTGENGRTSLPAFLEELPQEPYRRDRQCTLFPLDEPAAGNPLGSVGGTYGVGVAWFETDDGSRGRRITVTDGRTHTVGHDDAYSGGPADPAAPFTAPGGDTHVLSRKTRVFSLQAVDGSHLWEYEAGDVGGAQAGWGTPLLPPVPYWHFMSPRDVRASLRLRTVEATDLGPLLEAAEAEYEEVGHRRGRTAPRTLAAATALLTGDDGTEPHPSLAMGVAGLALNTVPVRKDLAAFTRRADAARRSETKAEPESKTLTQALSHLLSAHMFRKGSDNTVAHVEHASRFLDGRMSTSDAHSGPTPTTDWAPLIGRVGALAWYAALPTTPPEHREALAGFLTRWSGTVFAEPGLTLDAGVLDARNAASVRPRDEAGARHLGLGPGSGSSTSERYPFSFVESRSDAPLPMDEGLSERWRRRADLGWGSGEQLSVFTRCLAEYGALPWDSDAVAVLAERTGLARAGAALLFAAHRTGYERRVDTRMREVMGLSAADVAVGLAELDSLEAEELLELYRTALPEDPAAIGALWKPGGTVVVAERLAEAWNGRRGRRPSLSEETLASFHAARLVDGQPVRYGFLREARLVSGHEALRVAADPSAAGVRSEGVSSRFASWQRHHGPAPRSTRFVEKAGDLPWMLTDLVHVIAWAHAELPVGDPVREAVPALLRAVRECLASPELFLPVATVWSGPALQRLVEELGDRPYRDRRGGIPFPDSVDGGSVVVIGEDGVTSVWFRPSEFGDDVTSHLLRALLADTGSVAHDEQLVRAVDLLRGPGFTAIAEHVSSGGLREGRRAGDPVASVPGLVGEVENALGVSADAARLYLQLLALLEPTDRRVRDLNGWTAKRHRKAQDELVAAGLVVTAKRARSGRSVFLPGAWSEAKAPNLPLETWKLPLYDLRAQQGGDPVGPLPRYLAPRPLPEVFADAWRRVREGDAPV
ncbi:hypothetical protein [Nocardiopsis halotolerans]|uniref:hypothetical protein n=1 Tax=Nocardiopsis halotolerans TaxID=124252 RepID=UPI000347522B|nr:hypothetical protein [Nocardiopsis halotolerans]